MRKMSFHSLDLRLLLSTLGNGRGERTRSLLQLLRGFPLNLDRSLPLRGVRMKGIDQLHRDINLLGLWMLLEFSGVPFGDEVRDTSCLLDSRKISSNVAQDILHRSRAKTLPVQSRLP